MSSRLPPVKNASLSLSLSVFVRQIERLEFVKKLEGIVVE